MKKKEIDNSKKKLKCRHTYIQHLQSARELLNNLVPQIGKGVVKRSQRFSLKSVTSQQVTVIIAFMINKILHEH